MIKTSKLLVIAGTVWIGFSIICGMLFAHSLKDVQLPLYHDTRISCSGIGGQMRGLPYRDCMIIRNGHLVIAGGGREYRK